MVTWLEFIEQMTMIRTHGSLGEPLKYKNVKQ